MQRSTSRFEAHGWFATSVRHERKYIGPTAFHLLVLGMQYGKQGVTAHSPGLQ